MEHDISVQTKIWIQQNIYFHSYSLMNDILGIEKNLNNECKLFELVKKFPHNL